MIVAKIQGTKTMCNNSAFFFSKAIKETIDIHKKLKIALDLVLPL